MAETIASALKERLRRALDQQPVTEADLRKLSEEGHACAKILEALLRQDEQRLAELGSDPASSLTDVAAALRDMSELRPDLNELQGLLAELQARSREFRAPWLTTR